MDLFSLSVVALSCLFVLCPPLSVFLFTCQHQLVSFVHPRKKWLPFHPIFPIIRRQSCCRLHLSPWQPRWRWVLCSLNSNSCIHLNRLLPLHTSSSFSSFFFFFCACDLRPPPPPSLSSGQVTLNYSSVWNEKAHGYWISFLKWWPTQCVCVCVFFLLSSFLFFYSFLQLNQVKNSRSRWRGISKVNQLLYLVHIFTFFMVHGQGGGVGSRCRKRENEE